VLAAAATNLSAGWLRGASGPADCSCTAIFCPSLTFHNTYLFVRSLKHFGILVGFCKIAKQAMSLGSQETMQNHTRNLSASLKRVLTVPAAIQMGGLIYGRRKTDLALAEMETNLTTCPSSYNKEILFHFSFSSSF